MAITEDFFSREQHETTEGISVRISFTCTWADWIAGTDNTTDLPVVGDKLTKYLTGWDEFYDDCICTDRKAASETKSGDDGVIRVLCFYTTENMVARQRRPDEATSWKFDLISDSFMEQTNSFDVRDDGSWYDWATIWEAEKPAGAPDDAPALMIQRNNMTLRITVYSRKWISPLLNEYILMVNNTDFLKPLITTYVSEDNFVTNWGSWDSMLNTELGTYHTGDKYQWLFSDIESERVNKSCFEYKLYFKHAGWDATNRRLNWDVSHGIGDVFLYPAMDLVSILNDVSNISDDGSGGG